METTKIIDRPLYTDRIRPYIDKNLIKVITGQRRVGKSYILKFIADEIKSHNPQANIITINLEDFAFYDIIDAPGLHESIKEKIIPDRKNYIFLDEIQEVKDFDKVIRSFALDANNDLYVTGSNSAMLSSEIASRLAGRSVEIKVHPLSYNEFLRFHKRTDNEASLLDYIKYGGLPYLINLPEISAWNEYLSGITDAIVLRDIVARKLVRNTDFLQRLLLFLADNIGRIFTAKKIADYLKSQRSDLGGSITAIQSYIQHIEEAYIINKSRRWDIQGKRFFKIGEKFFFEDTGIRNSIVGYRPGDISGLMENIVYNHLRIHRFKVKTGSLQGGKEIDFIAERDGEIKYIQVAYTIADEATASREYGNLENISDNYEKFIITFNETYPNTYKGIHVISLREFLSKEL